MLPSLKSSTIVTLHTDEEAEAETAPQEMCTGDSALGGFLLCDSLTPLEFCGNKASTKLKY